MFRCAAGGFSRFHPHRIEQSGDVADICVANRQALGPMLAAFADEMNERLRIIEADAMHWLAIFERAKGGA